MSFSGEVLSVVIDPRHERYGEAGEMEVDSETRENAGDVYICFDDGTKTIANDGQTSGISQYYVIPKSEQDIADELVSILPELKPALNEIYSRVESPLSDSRSLKVQRAQAAASQLIARRLFPEFISN
ncbi:MAG: hypothetical protein ACREF7_02345 [Candidatus Saccharimonadales bacterium]